jgi:hypothetical protein
MKRDTSSEKFTAIFPQVSPASLTGVCAAYRQISLVNQSGMIRTRRRTVHQ